MYGTETGLMERFQPMGERIPAQALQAEQTAKDREPDTLPSGPSMDVLTDALQEPLASPPSGGSAHSGRNARGNQEASGGGGRSAGSAAQDGSGPLTCLGRWCDVPGNVCMNAVVALVLFLAWWLAFQAVARPAAGRGAPTEGIRGLVAVLPAWLVVYRFLGQRAGALWTSMSLNLHRLRGGRPRHSAQAAGEFEFYAEWLGDGRPRSRTSQTFISRSSMPTMASPCAQQPPPRKSAGQDQALFPVF
jgi:hypothetical protein